MKFVLFGLTLSVMTILSITALIVNANNTPKLEIAQNSTVTKQRNPLNLVVPELVTIRLKQESYTGKLTAFNALNGRGMALVTLLLKPSTYYCHAPTN